MPNEFYNLESLDFNSQSSFFTGPEHPGYESEPQAAQGHDDQDLLLTKENASSDLKTNISSGSAYTSKRQPIPGARAAGSVNDPVAVTETHLPLQLQSKPLQGLFAWSDWWSIEILAFATSLVFIAALITLLRHIDGTASRSWPLGITTNGVVAALSTVTRASLAAAVAGALSQGTWIWFSAAGQMKRGVRRDLEDLEVFAAAPKGSWNSLVLLWKLRKHRPQVVSMGALLTILFLAFDVFTQQLLSIETRLYNGTLSGFNILRCVDYSPSYTDTTAAASSIGGYIIQDYPLLSAVYSSILGVSVIPLPATCPTGNCTWPIIPSLAWCGECTEPVSVPPCQNKTAPTCNYTTDPLTELIGHSAGESNTFSLGAPDSGLANAFQTFPHQFGTSNLTEIWGADNRVIDFGVVYMPWTSDTTLQEALTQTYSYSDCSLSLCLQALNISVEFGHQTQNTPLRNSGPNDLTSSYDFQSDFLGQANQTPGYNIAPGEQFSYNFTTLSDLGVQLQQLFIGSVMISEPEMTDEINDGSVVVQKSITVAYSSNVIGAMWKASSDLDAWIENIALAMTNSIRTTSAAAPNPYYDGKVFQNVIIVKVRWAWLAFPVALLLFSLLFLSVSIFQTRQSNVPAWKDNALALLLLRTDVKIKERAKGNMESQSGLQSIAEDMKVVLQAEGGVWEFRSI